MLSGQKQLHSLEERTNIITIRLTETDAAVVKRGADQCGQSPTSLRIPPFYDLRTM
jgi:hypothetical protein